MKGLFSRFSRENLLPCTSRNTWLTRELLAAVLFRAGDAELQGRVLKAASLPSVTAKQRTSRTRGLQLPPEQWNQSSLHRPPAAQGRAEGSRRKVTCISVPLHPCPQAEPCLRMLLPMGSSVLKPESFSARQRPRCKRISHPGQLIHGALRKASRKLLQQSKARQHS